MSGPLGRELGIELVKAMKAPIEGCMSVSIEMPRDGLVEVVLTYALDPKWLKEVGEGLDETIPDDVGP